MDYMATKEKAIEIMEKLDLFEAYIEAFKEHGTVSMFEGFLGFPVNADSPEIAAKIKEVEQRDNVVVYAVTHEELYGFEFYSFLVLSQYPEDWDVMFHKFSTNHFRVYAYVWNVKKDWCSEFGSIVVQSCAGGIVRVK